MSTSFPYLIISDANAREFCAGGNRCGGLGYRGWQRPDRLHAFRGGSPIARTIPRSEWKDLVRQPRFVSL